MCGQRTKIAGRWILSVARAPYLIEPHVQLRHTATTVTFDSSVLFSDRVG
jgi:hypothetical protein